MTIDESSAVQFGKTKIAYRVRRSSRRRTVAISIDPRLGLLITAPAGMAVSRLDAVVHRKGRWILGRLRRFRHGDGGLNPREFVSGESYLYLGRHYRLKVVPQVNPADVKLIGGWIHVPVRKGLNEHEQASAVRKSLESWYRQHAAQRLPHRVSQWVRRAGVPEPHVMIRNQRHRWASCDSRGVLRINWRIVQAPMALVDYVVLHELVHLRHKDHSKAFWAMLGRVMQYYEQRRERLRSTGCGLEW